MEKTLPAFGCCHQSACLQQWLHISNASGGFLSCPLVAASHRKTRDWMAWPFHSAAHRSHKWITVYRTEASLSGVTNATKFISNPNLLPLARDKRIGKQNLEDEKERKLAWRKVAQEEEEEEDVTHGRCNVQCPCIAPPALPTFPALPFTQQRRWRSAPRKKESRSGSNYSNSWRFGAHWAPHAQKQLLDFKITQNEHFLLKKGTIAGFENHPKLKIYSKAFSQNKYPWISQSPKDEDTTKTTHNNKLLDFMKITPKWQSTKSKNPRQTLGFQNHPNMKMWKKGRQEENPK